MNLRHVHKEQFGQESRYRNDGVKMNTLLKWITAALLAGFVWLVALYTDEYLRPYKGIRVRNK